MRLNRPKLYWIVAMLAAGLAAAMHLRAQGELDEETKRRIEKAEAGAKEIDVSRYPARQQENYKIFSAKCAQCHSLARPINSEFALPDEWERYVKRMMRKPGSGIEAADAKRIYDFLVYDSVVRRPQAVEEKLKTLADDERSAAQERIQRIRDEYDK
jgi:cytochrome c5